MKSPSQKAAECVDAFRPLADAAEKLRSRTMTIGELYGPAMKITDQAEADKYFEMLVSRQEKEFGNSRAKAEEIERQNLGYYAGYYDAETRARVETLFRCRHPVFGSIAENGSPTAAEAMNAGMMAGVAARASRKRGN